jgi:NAD(P)-dependent dehydrogenase (short-subunit alcohol dehydrogenase family)
VTVRHAGLEGRVAIITGAGKGLGRAFALEMAASGAALVINNRWADKNQPSSADAVVDEIRAMGGKAVASHVSVQDPAAGEALVAQALAAFGRLDAVVSNAGVPEAHAFRKRTLEDFREIFDINFFGSFYLVHAAWRVLYDQKYGRIVMNASSAGLHANPGMAAYSASKAAVIGLARSLGQEGERRNLRVNAIAPYAATAMTTPFLDKSQSETMAPEHAAPLAAWLASDACDVSAQTFVVGLGRLAAASAAEGPVLALEPDVGASVHRALDLAPLRRFTNAHEAFADFQVTALA